MITFIVWVVLSYIIYRIIKHREKSKNANSALVISTIKDEPSPSEEKIINDFPFSVKKENGIVSFYFNENIANNLPYYKNGFKFEDEACLLPKFFCDKTGTDLDYYDGAYELFRIGYIKELSYLTDIFGYSIKIPYKGVVHYNKNPKDALNDGDLCFTIDTNFNCNGNNPNGDVFNKYFYNEDGSCYIDTIDTIKYLVPQYSFVNEDDDVLQLKSNFLHKIPSIIKAKTSGYIYFCFDEYNLNSNGKNQQIYHLIEEGDKLFSIYKNKMVIDKLAQIDIDTSRYTITENIKNETDDKKVPYWEHEYIYGNEAFPNSRIKEFYTKFKKNFYKGIYIDIEGNTNYAFYLMFDIIKDKHLTPASMNLKLSLLAEHYKETASYCRDEIGKRGIVIDNETYFAECLNGIHMYVSEKEFQFKNDIIEWISSSGEFKAPYMRIIIKSDGTIDCLKDKLANKSEKEKYKCTVIPQLDKLPYYIQFGKVESDFVYTNTGWNSEKNFKSGYKGGQVEPHKISTLKGSPIYVDGNFVCEKLQLDTLEGSPKEIKGSFVAKHNKISSFVGMPLKVDGTFDMSDNELTDEVWNFALKNIDFKLNGDVKLSNNKIAKWE